MTITSRAPASWMSSAVAIAVRRCRCSRVSPGGPLGVGERVPLRLPRARLTVTTTSTSSCGQHVGVEGRSMLRAEHALHQPGLPAAAPDDVGEEGEVVLTGQRLERVDEHGRLAVADQQHSGAGAGDADARLEVVCCARPPASGTSASAADRSRPSGTGSSTQAASAAIADRSPACGVGQRRAHVGVQDRRQHQDGGQHAGGEARADDGPAEAVERPWPAGSAARTPRRRAPPARSRPVPAMADESRSAGRRRRAGRHQDHRPVPEVGPVGDLAEVARHGQRQQPGRRARTGRRTTRRWRRPRRPWPAAPGSRASRRPRRSRRRRRPPGRPRRGRGDADEGSSRAG